MPTDVSCCATLHITVLSCTEDGPVNGAEVFVYRPPEPPDVDPVEVGHDFTDDTGTVTFLVNTEGPYTVRAIMSGGDKSVDVEAECGVNNITVHFGLTDKICLHASKIGGGPIPSVEFTVKDDGGAVLGTCDTGSSGQVVSKCCVSIPGPGTYTVEADTIGIQMPGIVIVGDKDCGDKIVEGFVPGETDPNDCERHVCLTVCGCPAPGIGVTVLIGGSGGGHAGTTGPDGCATLFMSDAECEDWVGSDYSFTLPGIPTPFTGTVTGEPMNVSHGSSTSWCYPDCYGPVPSTLFWTAGGGWPIHLQGSYPLSLGPNVGGAGVQGWTGSFGIPCEDGAWMFTITVVIPRGPEVCGAGPVNPRISFEFTGNPANCQGGTPPYSAISETFGLSGGAGSLYCPVNTAAGGGTLSE